MVFWQPSTSLAAIVAASLKATIARLFFLFFCEPSQKNVYEHACGENRRGE
jgi:hypothetical protein